MLQKALPPPVYWTTAASLDTFFAQDVVLDTEWSRETGELDLVGIGNRKGIVQFEWNKEERAEQERFAAWVAHLHTGGAHRVIYQNVDADFRRMRAHGFPLSLETHLTRVEDLMLAHALLYVEQDQTLEWFTHKYGKLPFHKDLATVARAVYNAADVMETLFAWEAVEPELRADAESYTVYRERRMAKVPFIIHGEERGVRTQSKEVLLAFQADLEKRRHQALRLAAASQGWDTNLASSRDMQLGAYVVEGFPLHQKRRPGTYEETPSLDKEILAKLRRSVGTEWDEEDEPTFAAACENIEAGGNGYLEARNLFYGAQQALGHYLAPCFTWDAKDEKITGVRPTIYPETRQHVQASGRESVTGSDFRVPHDLAGLYGARHAPVELTGLPMTQLRKILHRLVRPRPKTVWLSWDWSNIEVWVLAMLAGDPILLEAKRNRWDLHTLNVCDVFDLPKPQKLTKAVHKCDCESCILWRVIVNWKGSDDLRRLFIKRWVFRLHYLGDPANATDIPGARALGVNSERSVALSQRYLGTHHWIVEFWDRTKAFIDKHHYVRAPGGQMRRLESPSINAQYREGCNHPMQGGVAYVYDTVRMAIHRAMPWAQFMFGAFDAQTWEVPEERQEEFMTVAPLIVGMPFTIGGLTETFDADWKKPVRGDECYSATELLEAA